MNLTNYLEILWFNISVMFRILFVNLFFPSDCSPFFFCHSVCVIILWLKFISDLSRDDEKHHNKKRKTQGVIKHSDGCELKYLGKRKRYGLNWNGRKKVINKREFKIKLKITTPTTMRATATTTNSKKTVKPSTKRNINK